MVFISHDSNALQEYCTNGILIDKGQILSRGSIKSVVKDYTDLLNKSEANENVANNSLNDKKTRWGTKDVLVKECSTSDINGRDKNLYTDSDEEISVIVKYEAKKDVLEPVYGITVSDEGGQNIFVSNTMWSKIKTGELKKGAQVQIEWKIKNIFNTGDYNISPAVANYDGYKTFDWRESLTRFKIRKVEQSSGIVNIRHQIFLRSGNEKNSTK